MSADWQRAQKWARAALGVLIAPWFVEANSQEWQEYHLGVHPWEHDRYLATF